MGISDVLPLDAVPFIDGGALLLSYFNELSKGCPDIGISNLKKHEPVPGKPEWIEFTLLFKEEYINSNEMAFNFPKGKVVLRFENIITTIGIDTFHNISPEWMYRIEFQVFNAFGNPIGINFHFGTEGSRGKIFYGITAKKMILMNISR